MFTILIAIKNREKRTNYIQSRTICQRRAGSWRRLRAHSTLSKVEENSTPHASQAVPVKLTLPLDKLIKFLPQFEVLCSAFFQESASPLVTSIRQNILSMLLLSGVLFRLSCIRRSLGVLASLRLLRRPILLLCARLRLRPLILSLLLPGMQ